MKLSPDRSILVVVDIQPLLSKTIYEAEAVLSRASFIARICGLLEIPILTTVQNPSKMGQTDSAVAPYIDSERVFPKMGFSAAASPEFLAALHSTGRTQVVIVGMETHICVSQTAHDLLDRGYAVVVCPDAVSARTVDRHKLGMERIRDAGIIPAHTESVVYEWLGSADNPAFRAALAIVKDHP